MTCQGTHVVKSWQRVNKSESGFERDPAAVYFVPGLT